jgi:CheY-like chemotaxis protein
MGTSKISLKYIQIMMKELDAYWASEDKTNYIDECLKDLQKMLDKSDDWNCGVTDIEIFEFVRRHQADVIISEIDLPELNGITALRAIKNDEIEANNIEAQDKLVEQVVTNYNNTEEGKKKSINKEVSIAETSSAKNEINLVIEEFTKINPSMNFGNKTERKAVEWLLSKYGFDKTIKTIKYAISIQGEKYAPIITTPYQLKTNLSKLMIYYKREQEPVKGSVPNF